MQAAALIIAGLQPALSVERSLAPDAAGRVKAHMRGSSKVSAELSSWADRGSTAAVRLVFSGWMRSVGECHP